MHHVRSAVAQRFRQVLNIASKRPGALNPPSLPAFHNLNQQGSSSAAGLKQDTFTGSVRPSPSQTRYVNQSEPADDSDQTLPVVNLLDYSADDAEKRLAFVKKLGESLKNYGFVAVAGHDVPPELMYRYYGNLKHVFSLPKETKETYVRPNLGRNRGYYELGQEHKASQAGRADLNEKWHTGAVANIFPKETSGRTIEFHETAPQLYNAMEKTSLKLVDAIGQFLDSEGLPNQGYLQSTMVNKAGKPIGSHLLRSIHYPPVNGEHRYYFTKPGEPVIRAGEHDDLNLITLLPESVEPGLEILRRKDGKNDQWMPIDSQDGHLICNSGKMLSLISGGEINEKGDLTRQGLLPSIRHRVVGNPDTLDKSRYSSPFFVTPHYDKPLKNLKTGEELTTGKFLYRRLQGHGSLDPSVSYETFRKNADAMLIKDDAVEHQGHHSPKVAD